MRAKPPTLIAQAGLPRAGSTLLTCVLSQNPAFTVSSDSLLSEVLNEVRKFGMGAIKASHLKKEDQIQTIINFCRAGTESWKNNISNTEYYLDKNRVWFNQYNFFQHVFPDTKFILCLRDLRGVINSLEKSNRRCMAKEFQNNYYTTFSDNFLITRIKEQLEYWWVKEPLVCLKEVVDCNIDTSNLFFFKYEAFLSKGESYLRELYDFLGVDYFHHDLNNIPQLQNHNDNIYWPYGDHKVSSALKQTTTHTFDQLTPEACQYVFDTHRWYFEYYYPEYL